MASFLPPCTAPDSDNDSPPSSSHHQRPKSAGEEQRDKARVIFNKTIDGHYRHGKTGYRHVGALFLTWEDDDLQCRTTEVDKLRGLFEKKFNFKTEIYEIPSDRQDTALQKKLSDFCHEYNSPEDLAIIYYGGHAYPGKETNKFKLAAKFKNDGKGDPTAFWNDIRNCLRLPRCDQLVILDCCYAAKAFGSKHIGKGKFELITSAAHDQESPAPHLPHSFTTTLYKSLERLIGENPQGFSTSHLYRDIYHTLPATEPHQPLNPKPLLFDQARHSLGRIWLRPQIETDRPPKAKEEGTYLKLKIRLNESPDVGVMNELAVRLQYLPHVDQITFEDLYAPQEQITDFIHSIVRAGKLRPLIRKIHARRQLREATKMAIGPKKTKPPSSFIKLRLDQYDHPVHDWSGTSEVSNRRKSVTWPATQAMSSANGFLSNDQSSAEYLLNPLSPGPLVSMSVIPQVNTMDFPARLKADGESNAAATGIDILFFPHERNSKLYLFLTPTKQVARFRPYSKEEGVYYRSI